MNIDPTTRGLIDRFAPHIGKQIDALMGMQVAFSQALTPEQQQAMRATIQKGPSAFVDWSKTEAGIAAIRVFTDALTGVAPRSVDVVKAAPAGTPESTA